MLGTVGLRIHNSLIAGKLLSAVLCVWNRSRKILVILGCMEILCRWAANYFLVCRRASPFLCILEIYVVNELLDAPSAPLGLLLSFH